MPSKLVMHPLETLVGEDIMAALARFRLVTVPQVLTVTGRDEATVRGRLRQLVSEGYARCHEFRLGQTSGKLHNAYSLTKKGMAWIGDESEKMRPVSGRKKSPSQAPHRALVVDVLIGADDWARRTGQSSPLFRTFMHNRATRLELPTKTADADAIFELTDTQELRRVYLVEVYCDHLDNGDGKPYEKLAAYISAGVKNDLETAVGITNPREAKATLVLVICDTAAMRDRIIRGFQKRDGLPPLDNRTWQRFFFKSPDELGNFGEGWHRIGGKLTNLPL